MPAPYSRRPTPRRSKSVPHSDGGAIANPALTETARCAVRRPCLIAKARRHAGAVLPIAELAPLILAVPVAGAPKLGAPLRALGAGRTNGWAGGHCGWGRFARARVGWRGLRRFGSAPAVCDIGRGRKRVGGHRRRDRVRLDGEPRRHVERQLPESFCSVFNTVARLAVRVAVKPLAPASPLCVRGGCGLIHGIAMLEAHVALIERLKARPARDDAAEDNKKQSNVLHSASVSRPVPKRNPSGTLDARLGRL